MNKGRPQCYFLTKIYLWIIKRSPLVISPAGTRGSGGGDPLAGGLIREGGPGRVMHFIDDLITPPINGLTRWVWRLVVGARCDKWPKWLYTPYEGPT